MAKTYAQNRKASFDYQLLDEFEAGIVLSGHETKAVKAGKMTLTGAFVIVRGGEAYLLGAEIAPYQAQNLPEGYEVDRTRKLLLRKKEIKKLEREKEEKGLTILPVSVYNKRDLVKVRVALAKRKKKGDKRETIKKRETDRKIRRYTR
ncbi:MAG: SsrA-binding protein SmpB [Candidatus Harrisonbacteria bacterium]|nr:SsrA-binding protein SmpB [Candidatus Harrisonbacteria bacterium]